MARDKKSSKYTGVYHRKDGWYARVSSGGRSRYYGPFKKDIEAAKKYTSVKESINAKMKAKDKSGSASNSKSARVAYDEKEARKTFSRWERSRIASKQDWKCNFCEDVLPEFYEIDHLLPLQYGGSNRYENIQAVCVRCHRYKTQHLDGGDIKKLVQNQGDITRESVEAVQRKHLSKMLCVDKDSKSKSLLTLDSDGTDA